MKIFNVSNLLSYNVKFVFKIEFEHPRAD